MLDYWPFRHDDERGRLEVRMTSSPKLLKYAAEERWGLDSGVWPWFELS